MFKFEKLKLRERLSEPVLICGEAHEWDCLDVHSAFVYYDKFDKLFHIYYNNNGYGSGQGGNCGVGLASSVDGRMFVKSHKNPLFSNKENIVYCKIRVLHDIVNKREMWFGVETRRFFRRVFNSIKHAVSTDGEDWRLDEGYCFEAYAGWEKKVYDFTPVELIGSCGLEALYYGVNNKKTYLGLARLMGNTWYRVASTPLLEPEGWEAKTISPKSIIKANGTYVLAYEAGITGRYSVGLAYSEDLLRWEKDKRNPLLSSRDGKFDDLFVADPSLILEGNKLRVYYGAKNNEGIGSVGLAIFEV